MLGPQTVRRLQTGKQGFNNTVFIGSRELVEDLLNLVDVSSLGEAELVVSAPDPFTITQTEVKEVVKKFHVGGTSGIDVS